MMYILTLWFVIWGLFSIHQYRMKKAHALRFEVINLCSAYNKYQIDLGKYNPQYCAYDWFFGNMPSANQMALSWKPIKLESYFKEIEINELKSVPNEMHR